MSNDRSSFYCIPCVRAISCAHQGIKDVKVHCEWQMHKKRVDEAKKTPSVTQLLSGGTDSLTKKVNKAEVRPTEIDY